jgi:hypothetical protein
MESIETKGGRYFGEAQALLVGVAVRPPRGFVA